MQCQKHKELLERWWNDRLTETERAELEKQLFECADCRRELEGSRELWDLMGYMPVPEASGEMQVQFNAMLEGFKATEEGKKRTGFAGLWAMFTFRPWATAGFGVVLLLCGLGLGLTINKPKTIIVQAPPVTVVQKSVDTVVQVASAAVKPVVAPADESKQLAALTTQMHEMREMMLLSLLQNPSASERIRAVSYTSDIRRVNPKIAAALLSTLNSDPNISVRLSTLEALTHFAHDPVIREGLVQSILQQDSPLVQAAMADVMLQLQEKRAIQPFRKLLLHKDLNSMVRTKIEQTITQLT